MVALAALLLGAVAPAAVSAAFGVVTSGNNFVVDAGSSNALVFTVNKANCDITSIKYRGVELQSSEKGTHIGSGLGAAASATTVGNVVKITCETGGITQYIMAKSGDSTIYLGTYITQPYSAGELRYLARLRSDVLPFEHPFGSASTTTPTSGTVEGSDVFVVNGQTRSKFYSSQRFIDDKVHCVYGDTTPEPIRACMMIPQYESSSGGPFFRDINSNVAAPTSHLYFYMNSGHVRTEDWRLGFHGPYYIQFSRTGIPSTDGADLSWYSTMGLKGYVADSERGRVSGTVSGVDSKYQRVVHWYNSAAQYWAYANSNGAFTSPLMKPGTYTMVLYQTEFKVATSSVTVSRGSTTTQNIASSQAARNTIWRIGDVDGQPTGFRNADKIQRMHPSDSRMSSWGPLTYTVGSSSTNDFAMALFKDVNNPQTIKFNLASVPSGTVTLRIATTLSFAGGRPAATVNGWSGPVPAAPTKIDSRGVTRGAYRGYGEIYDVTIPAGTLKAGDNTITISVASGSGDTKFLSANIVCCTLSYPLYHDMLTYLCIDP
jgi:rhamnogalacturonan endolyase